MSEQVEPRRSSRRVVVLAVVLVAVLAGSLALRTWNREPAFEEPPNAEPVPLDPLHWPGGPPPAGAVPAPETGPIADLAFPQWAQPGYEPPIRFQTDLDRIAPLGDGPGNAAVWFADFAVPIGARQDDWQAALDRAGAAGLDRGHLRPDDPLVLEAEPWVDQAVMRFYPDVWPVEAWNTRIPNLLLMLQLARAWAARGDAADGLDAALEDYRRAIRLGRLLRQDDVALIDDLVGLASIRIGLQGMYDRLIAAGDADRALVVAVALGEHAAQRLKTAEKMTLMEPGRYVTGGWWGARVRMSEDTFDAVTAIAEKDPGRRFRLEALLALNVARFEGTRAQRRRAGELLDRLAAGDDPLVAAQADWARKTPPDLARYVNFR